jgi:hypothetical protein
LIAPSGAARASAASLAIAVAGCGFLAAGETFTAGEVTVVDESGLVTGIVATDPPASNAYADAPIAMAAGGRLNEVLVLWRSSSCSGGSVLRLWGNALALEISAREPTTDPCPVRFWAITLRLNRVIDASAVSIVQRE